MNKYYLIVAAVAFSLGWYTTPTKTITVTKTIEVEKSTKDKDVDKDLNKHKETTVVEVVKPDGTKETTTTVVEDTSSSKKSSESSTSESKASNSTTKEVSREKASITISALAGLKLNDLTTTPVYGGIVTKPILGPLSIGVWGLTNTTVGCSLGLSF